MARGEYRAGSGGGGGGGVATHGGDGHEWLGWLPDGCLVVDVGGEVVGRIRGAGETQE
jgi:hypothetical protein